MNGLLAMPAPVPPLPGDPAVVAWCAHGLRRAGERLVEVAGDARALGLAPWQGAAGTAYRATGGEGAEVARRLGEGLVVAATEVLRHAEGLAELARARHELEAGRAALAEEVATLRSSLTLAVDGLGGIRAVRAADLAARVRAADVEIARWHAAVQALEASLRALVGAAPVIGAIPATSPVAGTQDPAAVARWWDALGAAEQRDLSAQPWIGSLDGVPAWARDHANRTRLALDLAAGDGILAAGGGLTLPSWLRAARETARAIERAEGRLDPRTGRPVEVVLHLYEPTAFGGDGRVALSYGDPGTADHVSLHVPGLGTDAAAVVGAGDRAWALYAASRADDGDSVAVVAWLGYDAPDNPLGDLDLVGVADDRLAREGGALVGSAVAGMRAARDTPVHLTAVGHSYGSTTVAQGAAGPGVDADDIVLLGSPGPGRGVDGADDLGLGPGHVWVGTASSDPVGHLGGQGWLGGGPLGPDPAAEEFGANRFRAEDRDRQVGVDWSADQHRGYWDPGSESLDNLVQITTGDADEVTIAAHRYDPWWRTPVDPEASRPLAGIG